MPAFFKRPLLRRLRICFRWCRITVWLILFFAVAALAYLHLVGLPGYVKRPLLRRLAGQGVAAQFSNVQLGWKRGPSIILENASFSRYHQALSPSLSTERAELELNWAALRHGQFEAQSLQVAEAQLKFPVSETNGDTLQLDDVSLELLFTSNDIVRLKSCEAMFHGIQIDIIGSVTHAAELRHWKLPLGGGKTTGATQTRWQKISRAIHKIHFTGTPVLRVEVAADGRDMNSFHAELNFGVAAAQTPWGSVTNLILNAACARLVDPGTQPFLQVEWFAAGVSTPWTHSRKVSSLASFSRVGGSNLVAKIRLDSAGFAATAASNQFRAAHALWNGDAVLASSNLMPLSVAGELRATDARSPWGSAHELTVKGNAARLLLSPPTGTDWGSWASLAPWTCDWLTEVRGVDSPKFRADHLTFASHWHAPTLMVENVRGELYGGHVNTAKATLDIASRELKASGVTELRPNSISQLLGGSARDWLAQLDWPEAPKINSELRIVLPPWINRPTNWSTMADDSLQLAGNFTTGAAAFSHVRVLSSSGNITYTNRAWHIWNLHAVRADGDIHFEYTTGAEGYRYLIDSHLDPHAILPMVPAAQRHILDGFVFKQAPLIHVDIRSGWRAPWGVGFSGSVQASNFTAYGEAVTTGRATVDYTNLILTVRDASVSNQLNQAQAPWTQVDFGSQIVNVTNATGKIDPAVLQRVLSDPPDFLAAMQFEAPASVSVSGFFSLTNSLAADLHFVAGAERVHYSQLIADRASMAVDWVGEMIALTNISASLYRNGSLTGQLIFDNKPGQAANFRADLTVKDIDLHTMLGEFSSKTNKVEGQLDGSVTLTGTGEGNKNNWKGRGRIHVHDALLWDIKIFSLLSPILNAISPGAGNSRARAADATFVITNGAITSHDLDIRSLAFRVNYRGTVTMDGKINARVEAVLLRDLPVLGRVLSLVFAPFSKLFEYEIKGNLRNPVMEPIFVPKIIMDLLHPLKTLKNAVTESPPPAKPASLSPPSSPPPKTP